MIKWPITYKDYNGEQRKEDFYFHLSEAELSELELIYHTYGDSETSGFAGYLQETVRSGDGQRIVNVIKDLIKRAYGIRTPDGRSFIKTEHDYLVFSGTPAYSELFMQLAYNPDITAKFFVGILPASMQGAAQQRLAETPGFRPGADTSRPVPPVAGGGAHAAPVAEGTSGGFPVDNTPSMEPIVPQESVETKATDVHEPQSRPIPGRSEDFVYENSAQAEAHRPEQVGYAETPPQPQEIFERAEKIAAAEHHTMSYDQETDTIVPAPNTMKMAEEQLVAEQTQDYSQQPVAEEQVTAYPLGERPAQPYDQ